MLRLPPQQKTYVFKLASGVNCSMCSAELNRLCSTSPRKEEWLSVKRFSNFSATGTNCIHLRFTFNSFLKESFGSLHS